MVTDVGPLFSCIRIFFWMPISPFHVETMATSSPAQSTTSEGSISDHFMLLIIVLCIGGVIIVASIIVIIIVVIFVRKSQRELRENQLAHVNSVKPVARRPPSQQQTGIDVVRVQPGGSEQKEEKRKRQDAKEGQEKGTDEMQGYYAQIPRDELLENSNGAEEGKAVGGIVYAALEFLDDQVEGESAAKEGTTSIRTPSGTGVCVSAIPPETYVEMMPLESSVQHELTTSNVIYSLAKDPNDTSRNKAFEGSHLECTDVVNHRLQINPDQ